MSSVATEGDPDSRAKVFHDAGAEYVMFDHEAPRRFYLVAQHYPDPTLPWIGSTPHGI